jgi:DNA processing protein
LAPLVDRTVAWLAQGADRHILVMGDRCYPAALLESPDPPLLLYAIGRLSLLQRPALAIVGSRNPTVQGRETAQAFAGELARSGITVVSGLATGIDAAAHEGALAAGKHPESGAPAQGDTAGSTIAVIGTGADRVYPRAHHALTQQIAECGLILSEFSLGAPPLAQNFPQRNRIIAGLTLGTLVIEAALQSGSLITARLASEAGREVFAVPGSIHAPQSRGCHALIKQGAKLVECLDDILAELRLARAPMSDSGPALSPHDADADAAQAIVGSGLPASGTVADKLLTALGWSPATLDVLQLRTGLSTSDLALHLLTLELDGQVARLPGELFQRIVRA